MCSRQYFSLFFGVHGEWDEKAGNEKKFLSFSALLDWNKILRTQKKIFSLSWVIVRKFTKRKVFPQFFLILKNIKCLARSEHSKTCTLQNFCKLNCTRWIDSINMKLKNAKFFLALI